jgi:DNA-binding MarR family transcriptional regulator
MLRAHSALTRALDAELAREHDLPLSSYEVLLFLNESEQGRMRMSELADSVLLSRSGLTRLVDRLEQKGLLRAAWAESSTGRNTKVYSLTPAGRKHLAEQRQSWERFSGALAAILRVT